MRGWSGTIWTSHLVLTAPQHWTATQTLVGRLCEKLSLSIMIHTCKALKTNTAHNTAHHGNRQRSTPMCGAAEFLAPPAIVALISLALAKQ